MVDLALSTLGLKAKLHERVEWWGRECYVPKGRRELPHSAAAGATSASAPLVDLLIPASLLQEGLDGMQGQRMPHEQRFGC